MNARRGVSLAAALLMGFFLASRLLGFVRQAAITAVFGVGAEADAWFAAFRLPDTLFTLFAGGALISALIPVYTEFRDADQRERVSELVSGIFNSLAVFMVVAGALGALLAEPLTDLLLPGFDAETRATTVEATRWLMISPLLLGLSAVAKGVLQSERQFLLPALGPVLYNLGTIFGAVFLTDEFGVMGLVWGTLAGALVHMAIQAPRLARVGIRYRVRSGPGDRAVRRVLRLMAPRLLGFAVVQSSFFFVNFLASYIGESSVAALANGWLLLLFPLGVLAIPFAEASLPAFASLWAGGDRQGLSQQYHWALRNVLFLTAPAAAGLIVVATPLIGVLFERRAFDADATALTAAALVFYAVGLVGHAAVEVLVRAFFAMQDTRTPVLVAVGSLVVHMLLSWLLSIWMGIGGLALGVSIGALLEAGAMYWLLRRRLPGPEGGFALGTARVGAMAVLAALVVLGLRLATWPGGASSVANAGWLALYVLAGALVYGIGMLLLGAEEARGIRAKVMEWLGRGNGAD
ncbi:MAG: murein biosynthesis integral membrane protein MurJ [Chloroflexota bacterium]|nr:murein biosynthesis integral membrane protein MurJ [Chloroflexota bacterium]